MLASHQQLLLNPGKATFHIPAPVTVPWKVAIIAQNIGITLDIAHMFLFARIKRSKPTLRKVYFVRYIMIRYF